MRCAVGSLTIRTSGAIASLGDEGVQPGCLVVVDGGRLLDEHHGDVVADLVRAAQPWVEEHLFTVEVVQRALVFGAGEDGEQCWIETHRGSVRLG